MDGKPGTISLKSKKENGYISQKGSDIYLSRDDGTSMFNSRTSFYERKNKYFGNYSALEASIYNGYYLRNKVFLLYLDKEQPNDEMYQQATSFMLIKVNS